MLLKVSIFLIFQNRISLIALHLADAMEDGPKMHQNMYFVIKMASSIPELITRIQQQMASAHLISAKQLEKLININMWKLVMKETLKKKQLLSVLRLYVFQLEILNLCHTLEEYNMTILALVQEQIMQLMQQAMVLKTELNFGLSIIILMKIGVKKDM